MRFLSSRTILSISIFTDPVYIEGSLPLFEALAKLASASGINSSYIFPIYRTTKHDGSTTVSYRKDSADKFGDKGNYVVVPRSFQQTASYDVDRIGFEDLKYRQRLMQIPGHCTNTRDYAGHRRRAVIS